MDSKTCNSSSSSISNPNNNNNNNQTIYLLKSFSENPYGRFGPPRVEAEAKATTRSSSAPPPSSSSSNIVQGILRKLKRKFRKEKKVFSSNHLVIVPYNSYTYAKNFDDKDLILSEPDNLSRSFSSRFAASSGMLNRVQSVR